MSGAVATHVASRAGVLHALEPVVGEFIADYDEKRRLWWPSELLPPATSGHDGGERERMRRAARDLPPSFRAAIAMNLLTEEGLPHFHRLVGDFLHPTAHLREWLNLWTAEEDRHGNVLRDYVTLTDVLDRNVLELMQYAYLRAGFDPGWDGDPYRVFVYTSLQERATQIAHSNAGKQAGEVEPVIGRIFQRVAEDEARHYAFYRRMFKEVLSLDPDGALVSALQVMPLMAMPGGSMPHFRDFAEVVSRAGIYTLRDYRQIVIDLIRYWRIDAIEAVADVGKEARDRLLATPTRLERLADAMDARRTARTFSFDVAFGQEFVL